MSVFKYKWRVFFQFQNTMRKLKKQDKMSFNEYQGALNHIE